MRSTFVEGKLKKIFKVNNKDTRKKSMDMVIVSSMSKVIKEAVISRCSLKGLFLKISHISQENTCVVISL